jgi:hypothetical protein
MYYYKDRQIYIGIFEIAFVVIIAYRVLHPSRTIIYRRETTEVSLPSFIVDDMM